MNPMMVERVLQILADTYPNADCALHHRGPFQLLIATMLSAQTTDRQVNRVTPALFRDYPTLQDFLQLDEETLIPYLRTLGLFRTKARNILATCRRLQTQFAGQVPDNRVDLESLPGVGRKTANVVLAYAFGIPALAVDTHVHRVANRIGLVATKQRHETERQLLACVPREAWIALHQQLIWHGRQLCKASAPCCTECPLRTICRHRQENSCTTAQHK